jgi:hypothetical protein
VGAAFQENMELICREYCLSSYYWILKDEMELFRIKGDN